MPWRAYMPVTSRAYEPLRSPNFILRLWMKPFLGNDPTIRKIRTAPDHPGSLRAAFMITFNEFKGKK
jgi:hypothetical protein